jgi:hypothetical protein
MKLSWQLTLIKSSQAISHVIWLKVYDITLMMGTEMVPEKSENFNHLTWLMVQEDFVKMDCNIFSIASHNRRMSSKWDSIM